MTPCWAGSAMRRSAPRHATITDCSPTEFSSRSSGDTSTSTRWKTSLLCAGVVPTLEKRRGYRVTYVRPLLSPRGDIWRAVGADPSEPLAAALTGKAGSGPIVCIVSGGNLDLKKFSELIDL